MVCFVLPDPEYATVVVVVAEGVRHEEVGVRLESSIEKASVSYYIVSRVGSRYIYIYIYIGVCVVVGVGVVGRRRVYIYIYIWS